MKVNSFPRRILVCTHINASYCQSFSQKDCVRLLPSLIFFFFFFNYFVFVLSFLISLYVVSQFCVATFFRSSQICRISERNRDGGDFRILSKQLVKFIKKTVRPRMYSVCVCVTPCTFRKLTYPVPVHATIKFASF